LEVGSETEIDLAEAHFLLFAHDDSGWPVSILLRKSKSKLEPGAYERVGFVECKRYPWRTWQAAAKREMLRLV